MDASAGIERAASSHPDLGDDEWQLFQDHFRIFPWAALPEAPVGLEMGCGTGLWTSLVGQRAARLHAVEPAPELAAQAKDNLRGLESVTVHPGLDEIEDRSVDFAFCLGALQTSRTPATLLATMVSKLKPGAPLLTYLCYALDNRPLWFKALWLGSDLLRQSIAAQPPEARERWATLVAAGVYWPLARAAATLEKVGVEVDQLPLSTYRATRFETMRAGAAERFTVREQSRYTAEQTRQLLEGADLRKVVVSDAPPFWTAVGYRGPR